MRLTVLDIIIIAPTNLSPTSNTTQSRPASSLQKTSRYRQGRTHTCLSPHPRLDHSVMEVSALRAPSIGAELDMDMNIEMDIDIDIDLGPPPMEAEQFVSSAL